MHAGRISILIVLYGVVNILKTGVSIMPTMVEEKIKSEVKKAMPLMSDVVINKYIECLKENITDTDNVLSDFRQWYIHHYY
jgi:hypothetical protein